MCLCSVGNSLKHACREIIRPVKESTDRRPKDAHGVKAWFRNAPLHLQRTAALTTSTQDYRWKMYCIASVPQTRMATTAALNELSLATEQGGTERQPLRTETPKTLAIALDLTPSPHVLQNTARKLWERPLTIGPQDRLSALIGKLLQQVHQCHSNTDLANHIKITRPPILGLHKQDDDRLHAPRP